MLKSARPRCAVSFLPFLFGKTFVQDAVPVPGPVLLMQSRVKRKNRIGLTHLFAFVVVLVLTPVNSMPYSMNSLLNRIQTLQYKSYTEMV